MAKISFLSNIASLQAQRRLTENSKELSKTNERLSSGLRITRASVDAAGIAIAASLNVDGRVFTQAIRNLNDGISLLNIAEGSVSEARNIVFRLRELAEQSANGVLTSVQRQSIDAEGQALISEYNRIIEVTEFNGLKLLDGTLTNLTLQAGYGTTGELRLSLGQQLQRNLSQVTNVTAPDGTFQARTSYSTNASSAAVSLGDVDGDGKLDIVSVGYAPGSSKVFVNLANGNGTFKATMSYAFGGAFDSDPVTVTVGDVNSDGKIDVVAGDNFSNDVYVFLGNGNGSFKASQSFSGGGGADVANVVVADLNGDGKLDIVSQDTNFGKVSIFIGNGNGTFQARVSYSAGNGAIDVTVGDLNGDGKLDVVSADAIGNTITALLGNGNGTFGARRSFVAGLISGSVSIGDVNNDGKLDVISGDFGTPESVSVFLGNGDGNFKARTSYFAGPLPLSISLADLNSDSYLDIITVELTDNNLNLYLGNGNGSFKARTTYITGTSPRSLAVGDLNADTGLDIVAVSRTDQKADVFLANFGTTTTGTTISFLTQSSSLTALTTLTSVQTSIENELANIGSIQSRLGTAVSNLQQTRENYNAAESRIVDVDVAEESANLVKHQILQNASSAILAQANQEPALLLSLLKP